MGDLKPLGSEKLNSDEKLKRILELTYYNQNAKKNTNKAELVKESSKGGVFGIVKEKDGYYVKRGLNEQSLDYIGGMFMKNKNKFSSYAEALKRLQLLKGQEELQEATKYVLKQDKTKEEAPAAEPSLDAPMPPPPPSDSAQGDVPPPPPSDDMPPTDMPPADNAGADQSAEMPSDQQSSGDDKKRSSYMAEIQKYSGKLGQELRDQKERLESDDIKYVLNMIISAVDLDKLELEDLEEISKKFDREDEDQAVPPSDTDSEEQVGDEEPTAEEPASGEQPKQSEAGQEELSEYDEAMSKLQEFLETPIEGSGYDQDNFDDDHDSVDDSIKDDLKLPETPMKKKEKGEEIDLSNYASVDEDDVVELDMQEIEDAINNSVKETLGKYFK